MVVLLFRYFKRVYHNKGLGTMAKRFSLRLVLPLVLITLALKGLISANSSEPSSHSWDYSIENFTGQSMDRYAVDGKHRGMTVYYLARSDEKIVADLVESNIEWVSIFPYIAQRGLNETQINGGPDGELGEWDRGDLELMESIEMIHKHGLHVMIKPHLWVNDGWR